MSRQINYMPLRDALLAAGVEQVKGRMLYQDYLNIVAGGGDISTPPITEQQWEQMCDMLGDNRPMYASTVKSILKNLEMKAVRSGQPAR